MSVANLNNFRQFYLTFPDVEKSYALRSQWTGHAAHSENCVSRVSLSGPNASRSSLLK